MNRADILTAAAKLITEDRAAAYGDAAQNFRRIANAWEEILGCSVKTADVALMMAALKIARAVHNQENADNWIDAIGYLALGAEIAVPK